MTGAGPHTSQNTKSKTQELLKLDDGKDCFEDFPIWQALQGELEFLCKTGR